MRSAQAIHNTSHCWFLGVQKVPIQPDCIGQTSRKCPLICQLQLLSWPRVSKVMSTLGRPILITILSLTSLSTNHWPALSEWCHGLRPTEASLQPFHQTLMDGNAESHNFCYTIFWIPGPILKLKSACWRPLSADFANIFRSDGHLLYTQEPAV